MQSPFAIFRKYQKECILVFGFLILISFTVGQSIIDISSRTGQIPLVLKVALAVTLVGGISWGIGLGRDRAKEYGLWGALVGAVIGLGFGQISGPASAVETSAGDLSASDINRLVKQRQIVNQFLRSGVEQTSPLFGEDQPAFFRQFAMQQLQNTLFGYGRPIEQDVVFGYLLRQEAEQMGIRIGDEAVSQFINRATEDKLSRDDFNKIRESLKVSQTELYDMIRDELQARQALSFSLPAHQATPGEYWRMFLKMNVTQQLEAVAIPTADFEADIKPPTKTDLERFFKDHKERFANQQGKGNPGFTQLRRIQVGFFEPDYEVIEGEVIAELENENVSKEARATALETATGELKTLLGSKGNITKLDFEIATRYERDKEFLYKVDPLPDDDAKPLPDDDSKKKDDGKPDDGKKKGDAKKEPPKKDDPKKPAEKPKGDKKPAPKKDVPKKDAPKKDTPKNPAPKKKDAGDGAAALDAVNGATSQVSLLDDEPKKKDAPKQDGVKKGDAKKPAAKKDAPQKSEPKKKTDLPKITPGKKAEEETKPEPEYKPLDDDLKDDIRDRVIEDKTQDAISKRLTDAEQHYLQGLSYALNTGQGVDGKASSLWQATTGLQKYAKQHGLLYVVTPRLSAIDLRDSEDYAIGRATVPGGSANPFSQGTTETLLPQLFDDGRQMFRVGVGEELGVARFAYIRINDAAAHVPLLDPIEKSGGMLVTDLNAELGFEWIKPGEGIVTLHDYIVAELGGVPQKDVKLERERFRVTILKMNGRKISKVRLEEPGIVEQVRKAWLLDKARPNAEKRAKELADIAKSGKEKSLTESLEGKSVTGKKGGLELDEAVTTGTFSWLRQAQVPPLGMQGQTSPPELSRIPALGREGERVGPDFMETVFEKLKNGEVGVVSNAQRTVYFVVKVVQRSPLNPEGDEEFRERFMAEDVVGGGGFGGQRSPYEYLAASQRQLLVFEWNKKLEAKYGVEWDENYRARVAQ